MFYKQWCRKLVKTATNFFSLIGYREQKRLKNTDLENKFLKKGQFPIDDKKKTTYNEVSLYHMPSYKVKCM